MVLPGSSFVVTLIFPLTTGTDSSSEALKSSLPKALIGSFFLSYNPIKEPILSSITPSNLSISMPFIFGIEFGSPVTAPVYRLLRASAVIPLTVIAAS